MTRYPLSWPAGWRRTDPRRRMRARFSTGERIYSTDGQHHWMTRRDVSIAEGTKRTLKALRMLEVLEGHTIISTNLELRLDGLPRSNQSAPTDPGVAVYWKRRPSDQHKVMAIDLYDRVADNLAAIAATLEAMRAIERHGGAQILERTFMGFEALPAPNDWRKILELDGNVSLAEARDNFRRLAASRHPDRGGSHEAMAELNQAWERARKEFDQKGSEKEI